MPRIPAMRRVELCEDSTQERAQELEQVLASFAGPVRISDEHGASQVLPSEFLAVLRFAATEFKNGHGVDLMGTAAETLTPAEAAAVLGVSRPTVLKLIEDGTLPADTVPGSAHRRLPRQAVEELRDERLAFQQQLSEAADEARATGLFGRRATRRKRA